MRNECRYDPFDTIDTVIPFVHTGMSVPLDPVSSPFDAVRWLCCSVVLVIAVGHKRVRAARPLLPENPPFW